MSCADIDMARLIVQAIKDIGGTALLAAFGFVVLYGWWRIARAF